MNNFVPTTKQKDITLPHIYGAFFFIYLLQVYSFIFFCTHERN